MTEEDKIQFGKMILALDKEAPIKVLRLREDQLDKTIETMEKMGFKVAAVTTGAKLGLEPGYCRVTFLPESAFGNPDGSYIDKDGVERKKDGTKLINPRPIEDFIKNG